MKKKLCIIFAIFLMSFAGCSEENPQQSNESTAEESRDILENDIPLFEYFSEDTSLAISQFSQNLFREILTDYEENTIISPLSAYYVLSMASLGANGDTLNEFESVLGGEVHKIAAELSALRHKLKQTRGLTGINMAGAVWIRDAFSINPSFNQSMNAYFNAPARVHDFSNPAIADEVNAWVYEQTEGFIDNIIEEIDEDIIMLLVNTLFFSARWADHFNPMTEIKDTFYTEYGESIETNFLQTRQIPLSVSLTNNYEAVFLPYGVGRYGFFMVRPTSDIPIRHFAAIYDIFGIFNEMETQMGVMVSMPELDSQYSVNMNDYLKAIGLELAFDENFSDLWGLIENKIDERIYLSEVLQQIRLKVHAEGTEAVASTVAKVAIESAPYEPIELNFNTPYVFMIYDTQLNIPLFMGVTDRP